MKQLLAVLVLVATAAAIQPTRYQSGLLVDAEVGGGAGPGTIAGNCYMLVVRVADIGYVARQCPNFYWNSFMPHEFLEGGSVQVRFENVKLVLLRPNGKELKAHIMRRVRLDLRDSPEAGRPVDALYFKHGYSELDAPQAKSSSSDLRGAKF